MRPLLIVSAILTATALANWPQAAGPNGTWSVPDAKAPTSWSVARNQNILWRAPLPNGGQSGIAVWGNRLFLTTFEPYKPGAPKTSSVILGHAIDAQTGKILWSVRRSALATASATMGNRQPPITIPTASLVYTKPGTVKRATSMGSVACGPNPRSVATSREIFPAGPRRTIHDSATT